ncbi:MAG: hypothetical protein AAF403_03460 [Pseudomonadota bacterium]
MHNKPFDVVMKIIGVLGFIFIILCGAFLVFWSPEPSSEEIVIELELEKWTK